MDWTRHYPAFASDGRLDRPVSILDIGCGYGGLTVALAEMFPDRLVLAFEIRAKVCEFVRLRIEAERHERPCLLQNAACLR